MVEALLCDLSEIKLPHMSTTLFFLFLVDMSVEEIYFSLCLGNDDVIADGSWVKTFSIKFHHERLIAVKIFLVKKKKFF